MFSSQSPYQVPVRLPTSFKIDFALVNLLLLLPSEPWAEGACILLKRLGDDKRILSLCPQIRFNFFTRGCDARQWTHGGTLSAYPNKLEIFGLGL